MNVSGLNVAVCRLREISAAWFMLAVWACVLLVSGWGSAQTVARDQTVGEKSAGDNAAGDQAAGDQALARRAPPLDVPDANAVSDAEMKPYAEPLEHTDLFIDMIPIRGGRFVMGSSPSETDRGDDEGPQHEVQVDSFWMGRFEITWNQYDVWGEKIDFYRRAAFGTPPTPRDPVADAITRPTPPYTDMSFSMGKENHPAICMTQHAARMYCEWLTARTGRYYRLPTEAEWEYACRAGTGSAWSFGDEAGLTEQHAWFEGNSEGRYHPVGLKKANPWGLHDMHGNVAEWVLDQYVADAYLRSGEGVTGGGTQGAAFVRNPLSVPLTEYPRVVRGGGWRDAAEKLRSSAREGSSAEWKQQDPQIPQSIWYFTDALDVGFRVVRPLVEPSAEERTNKWDKSEPLQKDPQEFE